jgi:hypothetical protein
MSHAGVMSSNEGWIRPALFFLAVSAAATGIAVVIAATRGSSTSTPAPARTATAPTKTVQTTATTPTTTTTTTAQKPPPARPRPPAAGAWPAGTSGYTDVLQSIPLASGRAVALAGVHAAARAGLPRPGVLVSSRYATLHPGYYVVFSGVYRTSAAASGALGTVRARGFPGAYQVRVARTG